MLKKKQDNLNITANISVISWRSIFQLYRGGQYFSYIVAVNISVISWRSIFQLYRGGQFYWWNTRKKPPTYANQLQTLSHNVVSSTSRLSRIRTHNVSGDRH